MKTLVFFVEKMSDVCPSYSLCLWLQRDSSHLQWLTAPCLTEVRIKANMCVVISLDVIRNTLLKELPYLVILPKL